MQSYVEMFAAPKVGRGYETNTGMNIIVSEKLRIPCLPYDQIAHVWYFD